eukprot:Plantae.Rhodophyta-Purpureofilum_apyrenoidigerum.ctg6689.p1 GENE.Plantae.Rhodophyta-Purpureofilum_apyrenoidigerum.ctg6689~~Plantae.Rhodophyta-Purpureofilum_apyrenoidigerum.ctg6689.p1  ORF type:complete len:335 (+),score=37.32 Plantae.Rhodophyta-Purpureofilum_apyrenoidigerum.ctg6689:51-1007(+)
MKSASLLRCGFVTAPTWAGAGARYRSRSIASCSSSSSSSSTGSRDAPPRESLVTWNVASLRSLIRKNPKALQELVDAHAPAAICLQETKLQESHVKDYAGVLPGYQSYWSCSVARKGYSGTAIFLRENVDVVDVRYGIGEESADAEGRLITLQFPQSYLVTCYTPNAGEGLKRLAYRTEVFETALRKYLRQLADHKPLLFCGDLNVAYKEIDLHDPVNNAHSAGFTPEERACFEGLIGDRTLIDAYRHLHPNKAHAYTYWNYRTRARERNRGWRIDYFLVSSDIESQVDECHHLDHFFGSDHCPVMLTLKDNKLLGTN